MNHTSPESVLEQELRRLIPKIVDKPAAPWRVDLFDPASLASQSKPGSPSGPRS